ncbi:MAG: sensor histidine kinase [Cyanobacteria bacterium J06597_16]
MNDLGKALLKNVDNIIDIWVEEVRRDLEIDSTKGLTYEAVHNGLPDVLAAVATLLTAAFADEEEELTEDALEHGAVRADQGYDITEVVKEYRTLRNVLLTVLEPDLKTGSVTQVLRAVRKIDNVLDDAVLVSLETYVRHRLSLLEQMHSQLLLTNQELLRLVQIQKDNVSHLAHELKNPLNSIIAFSSIVLKNQRKELATEAPDSMEMKQVERILHNGQQLLRLINNTVEASQEDSAIKTLQAESVQISSLVTTVVEAFEPAASEKGITLVVNCDQAPQRVTTDALRLQQILTNLVSNAIRYSEQGTIRVICKKRSESDTAAGTPANISATRTSVARTSVADGLADNEQWYLIVSDQGRGISPEEQAKVFAPYFRAGAEAEYLPESSGLGLTIVNKLVQLLQGHIELVSTLGEGSTFTVVLPAQLKQADTEQTGINQVNR